MQKKSPYLEQYDLELLAKEEMKDRGLEPQFSKDVFAQLESLQQPASPPPAYEDLRNLLWCSIDNDDSMDLDQLTYAEKTPEGYTTLWIAVADVDALVAKNSAIDQHALINTTSVYTPAKTFPMLPEQLSTNLTSLNEKEERLAVVIKIQINDRGIAEENSICQALVRNAAKLAYNGVGAWLDGTAPMPEKISGVPGLAEALVCQHQTAQLLKQHRHTLGSLTFAPVKVEAKVLPSHDLLLQLPQMNFAHQMIEQFMIAANEAVADQLGRHKIASLRRVVRVPKNWERIVALALELGERLPYEPNAKALDNFLVKRQRIDPISFPDLSLVVIKLLGRGEYIVETPGDPAIGHFGLALSEYTHSTAPNRRYPDLISQRQLKALINKKENPYSLSELEILANHCTNQEDAATKVERHMVKVAAAMLLAGDIGKTFDGIVTGASERGTWIRIFSPPVEGKIIRGTSGLDVGDRATVTLASIDIPKGFINFTANRTE